MNNINIGDTDLRNPADPEFFKDESFEMTKDYVPTAEIDLITLHGTRVLTNGNLMIFIAHAGMGKSSVMQAILCSALNELSDSFGFKVNIKDTEKILFLDTERVKNDVNRGWKEIIKRAALWKDPKFFDGSRIRKFEMRSYKFLLDSQAYINHLRYHISKGDIKLVIMDVVTDFLDSINDEKSAKAFVIEVMKIAEQYDCGILMTIHPNPKDMDFKARGHIGTMLMQKAESVWACFPADNKTKVITNDMAKFVYGKNRNAPNSLETAFTWDDNKGMYVSVYLSEEIQGKISKEYVEFDLIIEQLYSSKPAYSENELLEEFKKKLKREILTFDYILQYLEIRKSLEKNGYDDLWYRRLPEQSELPF